MPDHIRKQFTPAVVDHSRCLAREMRGGGGSQCVRRPVAGTDVCEHHTDHGCKYGKVTEGFTMRALQEMIGRRGDVRRRARAAGAQAEEEGQAQGLQASARVKRLYYMRHIMWNQALLMQKQGQETQNQDNCTLVGARQLLRGPGDTQHAR